MAVAAAGRLRAKRAARASGPSAEDQRRMILLARIGGMSHEEVSAAMGRSVLATRSLLARAMARLAVLLEE